jgi:hypothetical protein
MNKPIRILALIMLASLFSTTAARSQNRSLGDFALGYSEIVAPSSGVTAYGGAGSLALNVNNWLGVTGDVGLYHSAVVGPGLAAGTYVFGPRFTYRRRRLAPFAQVLIGGLRYTDNALAFAAGGGADFGIGHHGTFALRPQVEYLGVRLDGNIVNTVRVSLAFVVNLRKR